MADLRGEFRLSVDSTSFYLVSTALQICKRLAKAKDKAELEELMGEALELQKDLETKTIDFIFHERTSL